MADKFLGSLPRTNVFGEPQNDPEHLRLGLERMAAQMRGETVPPIAPLSVNDSLNWATPGRKMVMPNSDFSNGFGSNLQPLPPPRPNFEGGASKWGDINDNGSAPPNSGYDVPLAYKTPVGGSSTIPGSGGASKAPSNTPGESDSKGGANLGKYSESKEDAEDKKAEQQLPKAVVRAGERQSDAALRAANSQTASDQKIAERYTGAFAGIINKVNDVASDYLTRFFLVLFAIILIGGGIFLFSKGYRPSDIPEGIAKLRRKF